MKNILFVVSHFYGYEKSLVENMKKMGYKVYLLDYWSPFRKLRVDLFLNEKLALKLHSWWLMHKISKLSLEKFDILLMIRGTTVQPVHLEYIIRRNPTLKKIMYQWDSVSLFNYLPLTKYFDVVFTFDMVDAKKYSFKYLPLFCDFYENNNMINNEDIDLLMIGIYRKDRYDIASYYNKICKTNELVFKCLIYIPFFTCIKEVLKGNFVSLRLCRFSPVPKSKTFQYYKRSKVFLDVVSNSQQGYSMRTIECYGMNKKLITSNPFVCANKEFVDMEVGSIDMPINDLITFIRTPPVTYTNKDKFSISNFLKHLLVDTTDC